MKNSFLCVLFTVVFIVSMTDLSAAFEWKNGTLQVSTAALRLTFRNGVISALKTQKHDFGPYSDKVEKAQSRNSLFPSAGMTGVFTRKNASEVRVTYTFKDGKVIYYDFRIKDHAVFVRVGVRNFDLVKTRSNLDIHVAGLKPQAVITGIGSRTLRNDAPRKEQMLWPGAGFFFPRVLIAENPESVILFYNESPYPYHNLYFHHTPAADHVILRSGDNDLLKRTGKLLTCKKGEYVSGYWKISAHPNWLEAARSWQKDFEKRTGARPLWANRSKTIRNTHAVFTGMPDLNIKEDPDGYYRRIAAEYDPASLLLFYWNANSIITFGDHRYTTNGKPVKALRDAMKKYGFQWIGFHNYTILLRDQAAIKARHNARHMKRFIPADYKYQPDYAGKPEDFYKNMKPFFSTGRSPLGYLNPASRYVENYLVRNILNYAKYHQIPGFYLDITGQINYDLNPDKMVFDGRTYPEGDTNVFRRLRKENPELALMTEYNGEWIIPYIFYTWEGKNAMKHKNVRINHPLRGALFGSYFWTRETTTVDQPLSNAYYATLPEVLDDFSVTGTEKHLVSPWHNERAKLFIREKLFNALPPDRWEPEALAYYRSAGNGFFQFRKMPFGHAYTDAKKNVLLGIYSKVRTGLPGFTVPNWIAYDKNGRAIGLDPEMSYYFIRKKQDHRIRIEGLSEHCIVTRTRDHGNWSEIMIRTAGTKECAARIRFFGKPLQVFVNGRPVKVNNGVLSLKGQGTLTVVAIHKDDSLPANRKAMQARNWTYGYENASGLPVSVGYRGYYFNMGTGMSWHTLGGIRKHSLFLGCGRYGNYAARLAKIPADAKRLRFSLALKNTLKNVLMEVTVQLNGVEVFRKKMQNTSKWSDHKVDVSALAGGTALLTFNFRYADVNQSVARNVNNILRIGDIDFEK